MAASTVQDLNALLQRATVDDHDEVLKAANAALKKSKQNTEAQHVRVVALLNLDRFDDALRQIEEGGDALKQRAALEWSYTLYKVGRLEEAADIAAKSGRGRGAAHVEAQASYRAESFPRAADLYSKLFADKQNLGHEENDLKINARATDAQLQWSGRADLVANKRPNRDDLEAFETTYNVACGSIARGEFAEGELLLKRAKELCRSSEDLTVEDKAAELPPINVQLLYVLLRLGKVEDAERLREEIVVSEIPELSTKKIGQNNLLLTSEPSNPYVLHKQFHSTPDSTDSDKLFNYQQNTLAANNYAVELAVQKFDGVARSTARALSKSLSATTDPKVNTLSVLNAAAHARGQTGKAGLKEIAPLLERRPYDVGLHLTGIQLHVAEGNLSSAVTLLESFLNCLEESISETDHDVRYSPGLVGILVALYKQQGRKHAIRSELAKAASHWQSKPRESASLLRAAGIALLHSSLRPDLETASKLFSTLYEQDQSDRFTMAGYVASHAITDPSKIQAEVEKLPPVAELIKGVDVNALEAAGVPSQTTHVLATASTGAKKRAAADDKPQTAAKKRFRKSRLPKDYDPSKTPDPERWLPLRDRSNYRPKGKKNKQRAADRTQGGAVTEKTEEANIAASQQKAQQGGGSSKKKKGKGKR